MHLSALLHHILTFSFCRDGSKIAAIQAQTQLEGDVKTLQRSLAALQGSARQVSHLERAHDALAAQQASAAKGVQAATRCALLV